MMDMLPIFELACVGFAAVGMATGVLAVRYVLVLATRLVESIERLAGILVEKADQDLI